jgi:putative transposase
MKYAKLGLTEIRELRQLRDENARVKRLVADLTLDNTSWARWFEKSSEALTRHFPSESW